MPLFWEIRNSCNCFTSLPVLQRERLWVKVNEAVPDACASSVWSWASREARRFCICDTLMPVVEATMDIGMETVVRAMLVWALPTMLPDTERNWTKTVCSPKFGVSVHGKEVT